MNRVVLTLVAGAGALGIAACGSAAAGTTAPKATPSPSPGRGARLNGAAGQLVQIKGQTLILSNSQGDTTVTYTSSTPISETSTAALADITAGECIVATGTKDSTGQITAQQVNVRNASNGTCTGGPGGVLFGPGGGGGNTRTPNPSRTPNPQLANLGRANGLVTAVSGTSVTVQDQGGAGSATPSGTIVTVTVPTTVTVNRTDTVDSSALQTGECVLAAGSKNSAGVVAANSLTIQPAGPNGCFTGAGAGGGFLGGGRGFFGGGGG